MPSNARLDNRPAYVKECIESLNKALGLKDIDIWCRRALHSTEMERLSSANMSYIAYEEGAYFLIKNGDSDNDIARFTLCQLRGCCGICMTTGEYVSIAYRKKASLLFLENFEKPLQKTRVIPFFCAQMLLPICLRRRF